MGDFYDKAKIKPDTVTLVAGTCCNEKSGCYTMAHSIYDAMKKDDSLYLKYQQPKKSDGRVRFENENKDLSQVTAIILAGCLADNDDTAAIINAFMAHGLKPEKITSITYVIMPYASDLLHDEKRLEKEERACQLKLTISGLKLNPNLKINYLWSSVIDHHARCIGIPTLINPALITGPYRLPDPNICGLIYGNHAFRIGDPMAIFEKILKHINMTKGDILLPAVYCYGQPEEDDTRKAIFEYAKTKYNIKILFQPKVPLIEFQQRLRQLANLNKETGHHVTVFCDGACTLLESIKLGLNFLIILQISDSNTSLFDEFVSNVPTHQKALMEKVFAYNDFNYDQMNAATIEGIKERLKEAIVGLQKICRHAEDRFDSLMPRESINARNEHEAQEGAHNDNSTKNIIGPIKRK
jgi:hypothetical protein